MELITDLAWRIGGPQGSGVDTAARFFARSCAAAGLHVFGHREYYSNIMGRHSYYDVRVADHPLTCHRSEVDFMASFDAETLARNVMTVADGASPAAKVAAAFALIAPLATLMGMPFPRALSRLNALDPSLLPWAWGINGCASVIGAVLATLVAIHHGHTVVMLSGGLLYVLAAVFIGRVARR